MCLTDTSNISCDIAGLGMRPDEREQYGSTSIGETVETLVNYEHIPDIVDTKIGSSRV